MIFFNRPQDFLKNTFDREFRNGREFTKKPMFRIYKVLKFFNSNMFS